ncbi:MAG: transcriptional repressor LexA, partial [Rhodocyclaceae bacterium]
TRAEIARHFGFASPNAAESHIKALVQKGALILEAGAARGLRLAEGLGIPLIGRVAAGAPILAQEHIQSRHHIDPALFTPRADFLLQVRGASMINAGIFDGDLLAVHKTHDARDGQIVVARVDDDVTVKRFERRAGGVVALIAENPDYAPILVDPDRHQLAIEGVAVGLIRDGFPR